LSDGKETAESGEFPHPHKLHKTQFIVFFLGLQQYMVLILEKVKKKIWHFRVSHSSGGDFFNKNNN
jgi:hypothetical protein